MVKGVIAEFRDDEGLVAGVGILAEQAAEGSPAIYLQAPEIDGLQGCIESSHLVDPVRDGDGNQLVRGHFFNGRGDRFHGLPEKWVRSIAGVIVVLIAYEVADDGRMIFGFFSNCDPFVLQGIDLIGVAPIGIGVDPTVDKHVDGVFPLIEGPVHEGLVVASGSPTVTPYCVGPHPAQVYHVVRRQTQKEKGIEIAVRRLQAHVEPDRSGVVTDALDRKRLSIEQDLPALCCKNGGGGQ